ncbi:PucR family transcriptional regulator [Rhodococcus sp. X156]|uniref:PucR family transcriptional regulator n=1 Tax=Rhodococcus sp. X156 TaxID=2499145 RepID=UPI0013E2A5C5|nr:PucR family transcriptional regulator [Rhodococcus sp. X156]
MPHHHDEDVLTLARLLQEPVLRRTCWHPGPHETTVALEWVVPWAVAAQRDDRLDGVLVHAAQHEIPSYGGLDAVATALAERGAAALLVDGHQPGPDDAAAAARLPLVTTADSVSFAAVNRLVADLTLARETHVLRYGLSVHRALAELLYRGAELPALCSQMSRMSQCPVAVLDATGALVAMEQANPRMVEPRQLAQVFQERAERLGAGGDPAELHPRVVPFTVGGREVACVLSPIVLGGRHDGWLVLVEPSTEPHPHDLAEHQVLVEQAVPIVGTEMLRLRSVHGAQEQARGDFVHGLLHGHFASLQELSARAAHYGLPVRSTFAVVVASGVVGVGDSSAGQALSLAALTSRLVPEQERHTQAAVVGDVLVMVRELCTAAEGAPAAGVAEAAEYAAALHRHLTGRRAQAGRPVHVSYGRPATGALSLPDSYREARMTLGLQNRLGLAEVCSYQDLQVHAVLQDVAVSRTGRDFAADLLAPLRDPTVGDMEEVVLAYIASGGNVNAASRDLHIHRNTMLYKLDRASRRLGMDLRQADNQFAVWLAHTLDLLATTTAEVNRVVSPL